MSWLEANADLLPPSGRALDVACGDGRAALWLAERGLSVRAIDRDSQKIASLREAATSRRLPVTAEVVDLETGGVDLGTAVYDAILVTRYLHRPLFPALIHALAPAGLLFYETFTAAQAGRGGPTSPDHLLELGELRRLVAPLEILRYREAEFGSRMLASVVARQRA